MQKVDYEAWRYGPIGRWFFDEKLENYIARRDEAIGGGTALSNDPHQTALRYTEEVGITAGIQLVRNYEPFKEERNETKSNRQTPPD